MRTLYPSLTSQDRSASSRVHSTNSTFSTLLAMPTQRFRSNSSSSILDSPSSPTYPPFHTFHPNDTFTSMQSEPIDVLHPPTSSRSQDRTLHESSFTSSNSRLSLSPMGGAAGVMKKLLRRRRGNTSNSDGSEGGPLSPTAIQSFVIVGGQGGIATGATVLDFDPVQSLPLPSPLSPVMITLNSPLSPINPDSPKSPTFSQSMFTPNTGREVRSTPMQISAPTMTPTRGRPRFPSATDVSLNNSIISLSKASAPARKKINRRSLSADNLWEENAQRQESDPNRDSDGSISTGRSWIRSSPLEHIGVNPQTEQQEQSHGIYEVDLEFYKSSIEFLKTHHSRSNTADDWARRNKRKTSIPRRRQSESSLLEETLEANDNNEDTSCGDNVIDPEKQDDSNPFGPGSCWKDLDSLSTDHNLDEEFRSLLSSVDIMLVPCISSPTRYYDCLKSRKVVRTYLTSGKSEFDEMIEFGFPASAVIEDKEGKVKDCRFMTLRLTLTPWHARADESKLYGTGDSEKSIPLKEMVNKFISRTSARISCSPPARVLSLVPDARPLSLKSSKSSAPDNFLTQAKTQVVMPSQGIHPFDEPPVTSHTQTELHDTLSIQRGDCQPASSSPPKNLVKNKADTVRREKGFRILDPSSNPPLAPRVIRSVRSVEFPRKGADFYTSPPTTLSPTSLPSNQHQPSSYGNRQQSPRKGSLPTVPMPNAVNAVVSEESMRVPPIIPPRRKFSSPSIFNEQRGLPEPLPSSESLSRSKSTTPFVASSKALPTQPQPPQQTNIQPRRALTSSQPPSRSSPSSTLNANASGCQQQHQQYNNVSSTDADIHGAPVTRTSRAPSRKRSDQTDNVSARAMPTPTPRQGFDVNTMTTTPTTQEYAQAIRHPHHAFKDTHIPRSQYMPPVGSY